MWKKATVVAAVFVVGGSIMVYAQQRGGQDGPGGFGARGGHGMMGNWRPSADDMSAFADARIAALHTGLRLNADQEKNWPAFEQALRDMSKMRIERRMAARDRQQPQSPANPIERLQRRADAMTARGTALKHLADTASPLYQSLDDAQKQRFTVLARMLRPRMHHAGLRHGGMWRERFGGGWGRHRDRMGGGEHYGFGLRRFGEADPHEQMHGGGGMGRTHDDEDDDYRGPL